LEGLEVGQEFSISIPCDEAFGEEQEDAFITIPVSDFVVDGELDEEMLEEGAVIPFEDADKEIIYGTVVERNGDEVVVDMNHPLAGEDLIYEGVIRSVREATAAEIAAGEVQD
jgi:FKBP-type peptidyl-prolyl cis-trans isomerase SlyD